MYRGETRRIPAISRRSPTALCACTRIHLPDLGQNLEITRGLSLVGQVKSDNFVLKALWGMYR